MEKSLKFGNGIPVVIDVLRASSTIITALDLGIKEIIPCKSKEEAFKLKEEGYLLIGEKDGVKIDGFDIGNSPTRLTDFIQHSNVIYKKAIIKTTNATNILTSLSEAYIVSTLNLFFAKERLKNSEFALYLCGGNYGLKEDLIVGLSLYGKLYGDVDISKNCIKKNIIESKARNHLVEVGYKKDVDFIIDNLNKFTILPKLQKGKIRKLSSD